MATVPALLQVVIHNMLCNYDFRLTKDECKCRLPRGEDDSIRLSEICAGVIMMVKAIEASRGENIALPMTTESVASTWEMLSLTPFFRFKDSPSAADVHSILLEAVKEEGVHAAAVVDQFNLKWEPPITSGGICGGTSIDAFIKPKVVGFSLTQPQFENMRSARDSSSEAYKKLLHEVVARDVVTKNALIDKVVRERHRRFMSVEGILSFLLLASGFWPIFRSLLHDS